MWPERTRKRQAQPDAQEWQQDALPEQ